MKPFHLLSLVALTAVVLFFSAGWCTAQQLAWYDSSGEPVAYVDFGQDDVIYLWDGTPVAFLGRDGRDVCIFGFNRSFLGWYENGVIYDRQGDIVGSRKGALMMAYNEWEPFRGFQKFAPLKPIQPFAPFKPFFSQRWSNADLVDFLRSGED
ncbi:MAG: 4-fold beta flower protein [Flavobacteriales bacterium]|jgi:hypothetical protein